MANMICPKCGVFQEKAETCNSCGVIIAKHIPESNQQTPGSTTLEVIEASPSILESYSSLTTGSKILAILACVFVVMMLFFFGALWKFIAIIIIAVITLALVLWPMKKAAELFGAENATYLHVFLAQIVAYVLAIGAGLFVLATGLHAGWILILIAIGASYAKVLGTTFFRGLGITFVGSILSMAIGFVLSLILGGLLGIGSLFSSGGAKFEGEVTMEAFGEAAENVCRCGTDKTCLEEEMTLMGQMAKSFETNEPSSNDMEKLEKYSQRAFKCMLEPKPYVEKKKKKKPITEPAPKAVETTPDTTSHTDTEEEKIIQQEKEPEIKSELVKYEWREADISELDQFISKPVEIETTRGTNRKGYLLDLTDEIATVGKSRSSGGLTFAIPFNEIKNIRVYDKVK